MADERSEDRGRRPRIDDVAREAGVSKAAVSFAFNSPDRLNPDTAARILDIAAELGYRPHPVARMLSQGQTLTIGVLAPQALSGMFSNPFFGAFSGGVAAIAEERGYALHFVSPVQGSLALAASRATVDGFVALGLSEVHPEVEQIRRAGLPIVSSTRTRSPTSHPCASTTRRAPVRPPSTCWPSAIDRWWWWRSPSPACRRPTRAA